MRVCSTQSRERVKGGLRPVSFVPCLPLYLLFLRESRGKGEKDVDKFHGNGYDREDNRIIRDGSCGRGLHG